MTLTKQFYGFLMLTFC